MITNIIFISASHHLLYVEEAMLQFNLKKEASLLIYFKSDDVNDYVSFQSLVEKDNWKKIEVVQLWNFHNQKLLTSLLILKNFKNIIQSLKNKYPNIKYLLSSQFGTDYVYHLLNTLKAKHNVIIDEGSALLIFSSIRNKRLSKGIANKRLFFKSILLPLKLKEPRKELMFFSLYNLQKNNIDSYVKHNFLNLKKIFTDLKKKDLVLFLGSSMPAVGVITEKDYLELIEKIVKIHGKIVYYTHRKEAEGTIKNISLFDNVKVIKRNYPVELFLLSEGEYPSTIVSFYSAGLINLANLLPTDINIISYQFNERLLLKKDLKKIIELAYLKIKRIPNIHVIKL